MPSGMESWRKTSSFGKDQNGYMLVVKSSRKNPSTKSDEQQRNRPKNGQHDLYDSAFYSASICVHLRIIL